MPAIVEELVKLDIPARAEYVVLGRLALSGLLRSRGFSEDAVADLKLALTEACSNSVRHAYDHEDGQVHLAFTLHDDRVIIQIRDEGAGFHEDDADCPDCAAVPGVTSAKAAWASRSSARWSTSSVSSGRPKAAPCSSSPSAATPDTSAAAWHPRVCAARC